MRAPLRVIDGGALAAIAASGLAVGALVVGVLVLVVAAPWLLFWSVGALTGFQIPLTFKTWLAAFVLLGLVRGGGSSK